MKNRFLKALKCEQVDRPPVWFMRQAGRYLPEYRTLRKQVPNFLSFCKTPELACEATLQPLKRFNLDAAIIFSDILTIPDAMGLKVDFLENQGPFFPKTISSTQDINNLKKINPKEDLNYVMKAIKLVTKELNNKIPLIGFSGSPWTLATYMIEGQGSKTFNITKKMLYKNPKTLTKLLNILSENIILYLQEQINSGVESIMIFDTWGGILTPEKYNTFSLSYMKKIVKALKINNKHIPIILFSKNTPHSIIDISKTGCDAVSLDWTINLQTARKQINNKIALQGNLDPCVLYGNKSTIQSETLNVLNNYNYHTGHIFNLGHGIYPDINPSNVQYMIETIENYKTNN